MFEKFLNVRKTSEIFSVTPKTIRVWARKKILPGFKIGSRGDWRFTYKDIKNLIKRQKEVSMK